MANKLTPWALFLSCLLLLGLAATPVGSWADHVLVATRFLLVVVLSVFVVKRKLLTPK